MFYSSGFTGTTRSFIVPIFGHEIQQRHQVGDSLNSEVVVHCNGGAIRWFGFPLVRQVQQQPPECQLQQLQQQNPSWNGPGIQNRKTYKNLFEKVCSKENLKLAFSMARKGKTKGSSEVKCGDAKNTQKD